MGGKNALDRRRRRRPRPGRARRPSRRPSASPARSARPLSRLIVVDAVYDEFVERLAGAARQLRVGHPREMGTELGPADRRRRHKRVRSYVERTRRGGWCGRRRRARAGLVRRADRRRRRRRPSRLASDEIFGPVLAVFRAATFDDAIELANDTDYALTAGVLSRSPAHIRRPGRAAGRQRLRQPHDHRRRRRPPALRRLRPLRRRLEGRRTRLPAAVPRSAGGHREHPAPGLRPRRGRRPLAIGARERSLPSGAHDYHRRRDSVTVALDA